MKSQSPNRLLTSFLYCGASIDQKWVKIANYLKIAAFTEKNTKTANKKSGTPNRLVTSLLLCFACLDWKSVLGIV
jgi:hypothetical protein